MNTEFLDKYSNSVSLLPCSEVLTDSSKNPSHSSNLWLVNKCKHLLNEDIKIFKKNNYSKIFWCRISFLSTGNTYMVSYMIVMILIVMIPRD